MPSSWAGRKVRFRETARRQRLVSNSGGPPMTNISDLQGDEIAPTQLAVDAQAEKSKLAHPVLHLEADAERPDVLEDHKPTVA
jgi:hypothetical protein